MTKTQQLTLSEFLLARIAEDEANFEAAVAADVERLQWDGMPDVTPEEIKELWLRPESRMWWKRILAECEAKRRIVARLELALATAPPSTAHHIAAALFALALPYADHPDYFDEWRG